MSAVRAETTTVTVAMRLVIHSRVDHHGLVWINVRLGCSLFHGRVSNLTSRLRAESVNKSHGRGKTKSPLNRFIQRADTADWLRHLREAHFSPSLSSFRASALRNWHLDALRSIWLPRCHWAVPSTSLDKSTKVFSCQCVAEATVLTIEQCFRPEKMTFCTKISGFLLCKLHNHMGEWSIANGQLSVVNDSVARRT